ncbi:MAG: transposase [Candidatus Aminicenantes bacterium]|nr:transposase [Candidatus Aminicenantes bacterium]
MEEPHSTSPPRRNIKNGECKDLRFIYEAATEEEGAAALEQFSQKWNKRYPHVSISWKKNWGEIATFFKYPPEIRRIIYTTNPIESLHRQIKKVAKCHFLH